MISTVGELIERIGGYDRDMEIRLAINPDFPFVHTIGGLFASTEGGKHMLFIGEAEQQGYLPLDVAQGLGWQPLALLPPRTRRGPLRLVEGQD